jgi:hypothetical protein
MTGQGLIEEVDTKVPGGVTKVSSDRYTQVSQNWSQCKKMSGGWK